MVTVGQVNLGIRSSWCLPLGPAITLSKAETGIPEIVAYHPCMEGIERTATVSLWPSICMMAVRRTGS